jgi:hypothetical protein
VPLYAAVVGDTAGYTPSAIAAFLECNYPRPSQLAALGTVKRVVLRVKYYTRGVFPLTGNWYGGVLSYALRAPAPQHRCRVPSSRGDSAKRLCGMRASRYRGKPATVVFAVKSPQFGKPGPQHTDFISKPSVRRKSDSRAARARRAIVILTTCGRVVNVR